NIVFMMIFSVILGYGAGAIDTGLNNFISLHYESRHMNWLHCCWGLGVTISPLIMAHFLGGEAGGWRWGYRVVALIQFSIAILVLFSLKRWKKIDSISQQNEVAEASSTEKANVFKIKGAVTSIFSQGFYCSMEFLIGTWGATYLVNVYGSEPDVAARWVSLYYGGIMLGRLVSGFVSIKASDNTLIRGGIGISFMGIVLLLLPLGNISILGLLLIGFGFGPIFPSILHSVPMRFGEKYSADLTGFHMGGAYAIGFLVQLIFGFTASATTFEITPFVLVGFSVLLFIMNEMTIKKTSERW
ncbi:MAG: MFS transporter, partial [Clostridia bacterium]|nr:MFS transporter [Clostridia bacterium]